MAGIYLHIPFCKQACTYCDFHFSTNLSTQEEVLALMREELRFRENELAGEKVNTIYFGGGTPSIVGADDIARLIQTIADQYDLSDKLEVTLEANPDDIEIVKLGSWKTAGINRLSIGVQSLNDDVLRWMNRSHNSKQAKEAVHLALEQGFETSTIDLIYGMPEMSEQEWIDTLQYVSDCGINHVSAYNLTVENGTVLSHQIKKGARIPPDDHTGSLHYGILVDRLESNGWDHYEVSNFAKPGFRSTHNSNYWSRIPYVGVGPGAHSFADNIRRWNVSSNQHYLKKFSDGSYFESEQLTRTDRINEIIMLGLRTAKGIDTYSLEAEGFSIFREHEDYLKSFIENGMLEWDETYLRTTRKGMYFADRIASDLFLVS